MLLAIADSIKVDSNGDAESGWESLKTVVNGMLLARVMLGVLHEAGITGFTDGRIDVPLFRTLHAPLFPNTKRSAGWLLARVVRAHHLNGQAVARALANTRFQAEDSEPFTYDELTSQAIEKKRTRCVRRCLCSPEGTLPTTQMGRCRPHLASGART